MSGIERAPERESPQTADRARPQTSHPPPREAPPSERLGHDAYGCVDWFDYCPLPRSEPPVRRGR